MKKLINTLSIISVIAVLLLVLTAILWDGKNPRMSFMFSCSAGVLFVFAIPLVLGWFSLAVNKDKMNPKVWLAIYSAAILVYLVIAISLGFIGMIKDLPLAIREEYSRISGSAQIVMSNNSSQVVKVQGIQFDLPKDLFNVVTASEEYTLFYLPNSKYVIDIINGTKTSLIMEKKK